MSSHSRLILGFCLASLVLVAIATMTLHARPPTPPLIQGVLLPDARTLAPFTLLDHTGKAFDNTQLLGQWHLVSYGFTTCPDICPTTLSKLAEVAEKLQEQNDQDLRFLFYSVDHRRDTVDQMARYVPYFHKDFIGLTHEDDSDNPHLPFEQSLGILAQLKPLDSSAEGAASNDYQVSHGVTLFLINPQGELQAIFEPGEDQHGTKVFDSQRVYQDYLQIRRYLG